MVDLISEKTISINVSCSRYAPTSTISDLNFMWSQNEEDFIYKCNSAETYFITILEKYAIVRQFGNSFGIPRVLSVSPDWKYVAWDMGYMLRDDDGFIPGAQVAIANLECILENDVCEQPNVYNLLYTHPYNPNQEKFPPNLDLKFDVSGNNLIWGSPNIYGRINLRTSDVHIYEPAPNGLFVDFFPNNDTMLLFGTNPNNTSDPYLFSVSVEEDDPYIYLANPDSENMANIIKFYGWLTIP